MDDEPQFGAHDAIGRGSLLESGTARSPVPDSTSLQYDSPTKTMSDECGKDKMRSSQ